MVSFLLNPQVFRLLLNHLFEVNFVPLKEAEALSSSTCECHTLFGNSIFADDKVKMRSLGWILFQYHGVLREGGNLDWDRGKRMWGHRDNATWRQKIGTTHLHTQKSLPPKAKGEACNRFSLMPQREPKMPTPDPRLSASRTARQYISVVSGSQCVVLCHSNIRKLIQVPKGIWNADFLLWVTACGFLFFLLLKAVLKSEVLIVLG